MTEIRRAQLADHDALVALWVDAGLGRMTEEEWNSIIVHPAAVILVAADGEEIVGSVIASFDGWRAHIYHVAVASNQRHRGVAKALMRKAEEHLFREGAGSIYVMVHQQNRGGLALSVAMGYVHDGELVLLKEATS